MHNAVVPVSMTIRNVPDGVRDELAARATRSGRSLQEYMRAELIELAGKPSIDEWLAGVRRSREANGVTLSVEEILADRDADRP
jgi:CHAD domain-containing protein